MVDTIRQLEANELEEKPYDAGDEKSVSDARKKSGRKKAKERETLKTLMQYENGRELMFNSIRCLLDGNPVVPGDSLSTYYNLGQEHRAREIFKEIVRVAPKEFAVMIEENSDNK